MSNEEKKYRYPGTKPFEAADYALFKGRYEDIEKLYDLIFVENPVVLFSRSGLGKSSLLNAGLYTKIIKEKKAVPLFIRFGACYKDTTVLPLEKLKEVINEQGGQESFLLKKIIPQLTDIEYPLWYKFKNLQINDSSKHSFVLIFDQFEELFTYPQPAIDAFKKQLAELLYVKVPQQLRDMISDAQEADANFLTDEEAELIFAKLDIKILFAIRSDKLSLLNSLTDFFPTVLKYCYELKPLSREQAKQAIVFPAQLTDGNFESQPFTYTETALTHILDSLTAANETADTTTTAEKPEIETFQLQIVCKYAENLVIKKGLKEITIQDLGDIRQIFENHYRNIINQLPTDLQLPARIMIEEKLIVDKTRVSIPQLSLLKELKEEGLTIPLIDDLVNTHIIRRDQSNSVEISHDTLVEPILKYYEERRLEEEKANAIKEKEEELERIKLEQDKQFKEQLQKQELETQSFKARRNKVIIVIISVALALSLLLAYYANTQANEATRQSDLAQSQTDSAIILMTIADSLRKKAQSQTDSAITQRTIADSQRTISDSLRIKAESKTKEALRQKAKAEGLAKQVKDQNEKYNNLYLSSSAERYRIYWSTITKAQELLDTIHSNFKLDSLFGIELSNSADINEATDSLFAITKLVSDSDAKEKFVIIKNGDRYFGYLVNENPKELINNYLYNFLYSGYVNTSVTINDLQYSIKTFPHLNLLSRDGVFKLYEPAK